MANYFKIKHGFVSTGDGTVEGNLNVTGTLTATEFNTQLVNQTIIHEDGDVQVDGQLTFAGTATTTSQGYGITWTGFDKEGTTDFSDTAYIKHLTNFGGHSGSVLVISSRNDASDGIAFDTHTSSFLKHNGSVILTAGNFGSQVGSFLPLSGGTLTGDLNISNGRIFRMYRSGGDALQRGDARLDGSDQARIHWYGKNDAGATTNFKHAWYDGANYINVTASNPGRVTFAGSASEIFVGSNRLATETWTASNFVDVTGDTMTGNLTLEADNKTIYGPNSGWGKFLVIGGNGNNSNSTTASIGTTNGNLHIDAATGNYATYLNFYDGGQGVAFGNGGGNSAVAWMGPDGDLWKGNADNTGSKYWHAGNDGAGSGLDADTVDGLQASAFATASHNHDDRYYTESEADSRFASRGFVNDAYVEFTVGGDPDTFYPVRILGAGAYAFQMYSISRRYNWQAPDTWNTPTHRGGLTLTIQWSGDTAWGGNDKSLRVIQFDETYSTVAGGIALPVTGGLMVWLRGGDALYRAHTPAGVEANITVELTGYTASDSTVYNPRTLAEAQAGQSSITTNWPVRDYNKLYDTGERVATQNWVTGTAKAADANLLDGLDSSAFLRSNVDDTYSGRISSTTTTTNGLEVGGIRGVALGSQTGDYIHLYERVHIGYPSGWGASAATAPTYGLGVWGSVDLGMNGSGVLQIDGTTVINASRQLVNVTNTNWDTAHGWGDHAGLYLPLSGGTVSGNVTVTGYIKGNGQQLVLNAGESHSYATGQTNEFVYVNAESGLQINSTPDNWSSGWAGRKTAVITGENITLDGQVFNKTDIQNWNTAYDRGIRFAAARLSANADTITTNIQHPWDVSAATDAPAGAVDGVLNTRMWDWDGWGTQTYHDFHTNGLYIRSRQNSTWQATWAEVWTTDNFNPASYAAVSHNHSSLNLTGRIYNDSDNYSIDLKDHSDRTWFRNQVGGWTFQTGTSSDDWTQSFTLYLPAAGSTANNVWAELGQRDSNDSAGRYRGLRIVKDTGSVADGDLWAGAFYIGGTRKDQNWDTAYGWGDHASAGYLTSVPRDVTLGTKILDRGIEFHDDGGDLSWAIGADDRGGIGTPGQNALVFRTRQGARFQEGTGWAGEGTEVMTLDDSGNVGIGVPQAEITERLNVQGNVRITGTLEATEKSFNIAHPTKEGKRLIYGVLEGPEHGVYVRGKSTSKVIELPEVWTGLVHDDSITVQLTCKGKPFQIWVEDIKDNKVYIDADVEEFEYFYYIQGERKDVDKLITERDAN